jgi:hypothetical protein
MIQIMSRRSKGALQLDLGLLGFCIQRGLPSVTRHPGHALDCLMLDLDLTTWTPIGLLG